MVGTHWNGIAGAAWAHLLVGVLIVLPAYGFVSYANFLNRQAASMTARRRRIAPSG